MIALTVILIILALAAVALAVAATVYIVAFIAVGIGLLSGKRPPRPASGTRTVHSSRHSSFNYPYPLNNWL